MQNNYKLHNFRNGTNLILDNEFLDDIWQLRRAPELPVKSYRNPVFSDKPPFQPGGPTIIYDKEEKIFKCWYGVHDADLYYAGLPGAYKMCYMVSVDGLDWHKPELGIIDYKGNKKNNLIHLHPGAVYKDICEQDPGKRYKMLYLGEKIGLCAAFSEDGIHWNKHTGKDKEIIFGSNDTNNMAFYDPDIKKYVRYGRVNVLASIEKEENLGVVLKTTPDIIRYTDKICETNPYRTNPPHEAFPAYDDYISYGEAEDYVNRYLQKIPYEYAKVLRRRGSFGCNRRIVRSESDDYLNWSVPELVLAPDELDPARFYGMTACIYEDMYVGLLQVYNSSGSGRRTVGDPSYREGDTIDLQLTFSRDGKRWERLANRPNFIPRGYIGSYDGGMVFGQNAPILEYGDDLLIYYLATDACHTATLDTNSTICVARLPKGRLISRAAGDEMGALITKPFLMKHDRISLNLNSRSGVVKAEFTDINGHPISGYTALESRAISDNGFDCELSWEKRGDLTHIKGSVVRLRLYLWQSKLYSINFLSDSYGGSK